jgi:hypothetical protein
MQLTKLLGSRSTRPRSVLLVALVAVTTFLTSVPATEGKVRTSSTPAAARLPVWYDKTFPCRSNWIEKVRVRGFLPGRLDYMVTPTWRGRTFYDDRSGWPQVVTCAGTHGLSGPALESIRKQLVCHATDPTGLATGPSWDNESWRTNKFDWDRLPIDCNVWESASTPLRLGASNFRHTYVYAYRNRQAAIGWVPGDWTSQYVAVPGLAGEGVSFESRYYRNYYLRHANGAVSLHYFNAYPFNRRPSDLLFRADATFRSAGQAQAPDGAPLLRPRFRLEAWNYPGLHVRHYMGKLEIGNVGSRRGTPFMADSTWINAAG